MMCLPKIGSDPFARADAAEREREREQNTHHNVRREEQEEKGILSRFCGCDSVIFEPVFDLSSWSKDWLSRALSLRGDLSVQVTTISGQSPGQSHFGR